MIDDELLRRIVELARQIPAATAMRVAEVLPQAQSEVGRETSDTISAALLRQLHGSAKSSLAAILSSCQGDDRMRALVDVGLALRVAAHGITAERESQGTEIVWTGPGSTESGFRRVDEALLELIGRTRRSLLLATYVASRVDVLSGALVQAVTRGVVVRVVIEDAPATTGELNEAAVERLRNLGASVEVLVWPRSQRPVDGNRIGTMHLKCALGDGTRLLLSSANLTGHALHLNLEMGVFLTGGPQPSRVAEHFERLVREGVLRRSEGPTRHG